MATQLSKDRSFRFELVKKDNASKHDKEHYFNLIYPPERYTIKEAPRHSVMKMFGEDEEDLIHIDDFGDDNKVITLKGTTGSPATRRGYQDEFYKIWSGQEAMLKFREKIINWRTTKKNDGKNIEDFKIKLYNYFDEETYFIFITNFEMEKNSQQPLFYSYSMEMITIGTVEPEDDVSVKGLLKKVNAKIKLINSIVDEATGYIGNNEVVNTLGEVTDVAVNALGTTNSVMNAMDGSGAAVVDIVNDNLGKINSVVDGSQQVVDKWAASAGGDPTSQFSQTVRAFRRLETEMTKLTTLKKYQYHRKAEGSFGIRPGSDFEEYYDKEYSSSENKVNVRIPEASGKTLAEASTLLRDKYGLKVRGEDIADYNQLDSTTIPEGYQIIVPTDTGLNLNPRNLVLTEDKLNDYLGTDLLLVDGKLRTTTGGDFATIDDIQNVQQAIDDLLNTEINAFVTLPNYGFDVKNTVGTPGISVFIQTLKMKYRDAIQRDPRVTNVTDIVVSVNKSKIEISSVIHVYGRDFKHKFST